MIGRTNEVQHHHCNYDWAERKPLSPNVAALIGKMFGGSVGTWLQMQAPYDARHAEREIDVSPVKALKAA